MTVNPIPTPDAHDGLTRVGVRDLRHGLSDYLKRARDGERIVITDRGAEIAELVPRRTQPVSIMEQGILDGAVTPPSWWPGPPPPWPKRLPAVKPGQPTLSEIVQQMRDEDPR